MKEAIGTALNSSKLTPPLSHAITIKAARIHTLPYVAKPFKVLRHSYIEMTWNTSELVYLLQFKNPLSDLTALAEKGGKSENIAPEPTPPQEVQPPPTPEPMPVQPEPEPEPTIEPTPEKNGSGIGTILLIILAAAAAGGAGWYFKIYRLKQQADELEDMDDDEPDYEDGADLYGDTEDEIYQEDEDEE